MAKTMRLRVVTPDSVVVDDEVRSVRFTGVDGSYGILPGHAPLMTATEPGPLGIRYPDDREEALVVTDGFAEVRNNVLTVVCEAGERADQIDVERARQAEQRAREALEGRKTMDAKQLMQAEAALRRAMVRQMVGRKRGATGSVR